MTPDQIARAARHLIAERDAVRIYERLPEDLRPAGLEEAYAIQAEVARLRSAAGRERGGWKIGCTTASAQKAMGLPHPVYGRVLADCVRRSPATVAFATTVAPIAECEIAIRLASDVPGRPGGHDRDSIAAHVGACMTAIEHAEFRYADRKAVGAIELTADDFLQRAIVLGPEVTAWQGVDLAGARASLTVGGVAKGEGRGSDILGHPFTALAWLADQLAEAGSNLRAGDVVLTGSLAMAPPVAQGETAVATVEGLGEARLTLS